MFRFLRRYLPRFTITLLLAIGILIGGLTMPAQAASITVQTPKAGSHALSPKWGIHPGSQYVCCYTGKGYDVLFVHGVSGSSSINCASDWGGSKQVLGNNQWVGNLVTLQYYNADTNCTDSIDINHDPNNHLNHCNNVSPGNEGTNNEDDRHLACELAWYIWDVYTQNTWGVQVVAFSLGGAIVKDALYHVSIGDTNFPPYLYIPRILTMSSPLQGAAIGAAAALCGGCTEVHELEHGQVVDGELNTSTANNVQAFGGTQWTMEGSGYTGCDLVGYSAYGMSYGQKFAYTSVPGLNPNSNTTCTVGTNTYTYAHGGTLFDQSGNYDAQADYCSNCNGVPGTVFSGLPHSLQEEYNFLAGSCTGSPSIDNCDGDDPSVTGCQNSGHLQSGDVSYLAIYWSTGCSTNWAKVTVPFSGSYLVMVTLARSPTGDWNNVDRHLVYCAPTRTTCPNDTWWTFGQYTPSWFTDMLYAPSEKVAVRIVTTTGTYTSIWH